MGQDVTRCRSMIILSSFCASLTPNLNSPTLTCLDFFLFFPFIFLPHLSIFSFAPPRIHCSVCRASRAGVQSREKHLTPTGKKQRKNATGMKHYKNVLPSIIRCLRYDERIQPKIITNNFYIRVKLKKCSNMLFPVQPNVSFIISSYSCSILFHI